jgi:hypothetical protein
MHVCVSSGSALPCEANDARGRCVVCVFERKFRDAPCRRNNKNDQIWSHPAAFPCASVMAWCPGTFRCLPGRSRAASLGQKWSTFRLSPARRSPNFVIESTNGASFRLAQRFRCEEKCRRQRMTFPLLARAAKTSLLGDAPTTLPGSVMQRRPDSRPHALP